MAPLDVRPPEGVEHLHHHTRHLLNELGLDEFIEVEWVAWGCSTQELYLRVGGGAAGGRGGDAGAAGGRGGDAGSAAWLHVGAAGLRCDGGAAGR